MDRNPTNQPLRELYVTVTDYRSAAVVCLVIKLNLHTLKI